MDVTRLLQTPNVLSGEDGATGRSASRGIAKGMREAQSFLGDAIEGRRFYDRIPMTRLIGSTSLKKKRRLPLLEKRLP